MAKILVIRGGAIGDFILTLPVLAALKEQFPQAELEVLGYPHIASLATEGGLACVVRSIDARPLAGFFAHDGQLDPGLQKYFSNFAVILSFLYDPDEIFCTNVARCSRAQFIVGPHRPDEQAGIHATEVYLKTLERLAIFSPDPVPHLSVTGGAKPSDATPSDATLAVHPGSGSARKNWPEANWAELLQLLCRAPLASGLWPRLLLVGGEAEEGRLERLSTRLPTDRVEIARSLPLPTLARRLANCTGFVGHDSGISHLAAALGLPVLALWGETAEAVWRPRGRVVMVLKAPTGLEQLSIARVLEQVQALLDGTNALPDQL